MTRQNFACASALVASLTATATNIPVVNACGGFFCSQVPVVQNGEQIVFAVDDNHVTAHIRIFYTGDAKKFAWVVPVPSVPKISVGTEALFSQLAFATEPQFRVQWSERVNACFPQNSSVDGGSFASGGTSGSVPTSSVNVLLEQDVGPYDAKVIESSDAQALITWLNDNGYDQPPSALPLIRHYVDRKMKFLAIKLQKDASVGDITPLVLDMDEPDPCVPLVLTRVAATSDMPISVYVLGKSRAVPKNWFHVEVNPRKIDWLRGGLNYNALATLAINEAAGHGFVTEFAGPTPALPGLGVSVDLVPLRATKDPVTAIEIATRSIPRTSSGLLLDLLRKYVPLPQKLRDEGVSETQFYNAPRNFAAALAGVQVDGAAFADAILERIIKPAQDASAMLAKHPYLTRLYSTVSPDEMTRDPLFSLRADLPVVSNIHVAKGDGNCVDGKLQDARLTLPSGEELGFSTAFSIYNPPVWTGGVRENSAEHIAFVAPGQPPVFLSALQASTGDGLLQALEAENLRASDFGPAAADGEADPRPNSPSNLSATNPPGWNPGTRSPVMVDDPGATGGDAGGSPARANAGDGNGCACALGQETEDSFSWPGLLVGVVAFGMLRRRARNRPVAANPDRL
ncbi:MAG: DUF2330 domain-containing protein [Deltaproteobacteria bacterium]|nr:DUF2330 domain-containing protein [Deltaproteobacteria bacterium]